MKKSYLIADVSGGYWSSDDNRFRGIIFATRYDTKDLAEEDMVSALSQADVTTCKIEEVYDEL